MGLPMTLSLIILTRNESRNISECLESVEGADEILVVDDFSDDDTVSLAENSGARVLRRKLDSFAGQRNFALAESRGDWVFFLDADERFSSDLMEMVRVHMASGDEGPGSIKRRNFAFGLNHHFGPLKPDRVVRLFKRGSVRWEGAVHERPVYSGTDKHLNGYLKHLTYRDWDHYLTKQFRYATLWAAEASARGRKAGPFKAVVRGALGFFKMMVLNLGILGGPVCWALCWYHGAYTLTKYLKLSELNRK